MSDAAGTSIRIPFSRSFATAGLALGFAIGGFFDGILLHQILQWHHLLSALDGGPLADIRVQILADGVFHLAMYLVGAVGLALLWRSRTEVDRPGAGPLLSGCLLLGFGGWHVVDAVLSHWLLGIHRIRMDSEVPLAWDLGWMAVFGVLPAVVGLWISRVASSGGGRSIASAIVAATLVGGPVAALPSPNARGTVVLFQAGVAPADAMSALASLSGRVIWADGEAGLWAVDFGGSTPAAALYRRGALLVSSSIVPVGCLGWSKAE